MIHMDEHKKFEHNLAICRQYAAAIVGWLKAIGLDETDVDQFEKHMDTVLAKASMKIPPPAKIIDIKDYLQSKRKV